MELLVVVAVLGLALALAVPSLSRALPGFDLRAGAHTVASALREARSLAIGQNREILLILDVERRALLLGDNAPIRLNPELGMSIQSASSEASAAGAAGISFFPDGTSTGGRVTLTRGERQRHVVVDWLTGTVSIVE